MLEYNVIINKDKRECLHPHKLGMGMELKKICKSQSCGVIAYLLATRWSGDRIAIVGDSTAVYFEARGGRQAMNGEIPYKDISLEAREEFEKFTGAKLPKRWDAY